MDMKQLLVVHPERHIRRLAQVNLERQGYMVDCAGNTVEAIDLLNRSIPDAICLDLLLPDRVDLLSRLQAEPMLRQIPIYTLPTNGFKFNSKPWSDDDSSE